MNVPTLPQHKFTLDETQTVTSFDNALGVEWNYLRNYKTENYNIKGGNLTLTASTESIDKDGTPTWVGRRQQHKNFRATTVATLEGKQEGDEVGISVYMKCFTHYDLSIIKHDDGKVTSGFVIALAR